VLQDLLQRRQDKGTRVVHRVTLSLFIFTMLLDPVHWAVLPDARALSRLIPSGIPGRHSPPT